MAIISFSRRFIFVKTTKTASTSLEVHLSHLCGPDDIVTPIAPPNESHHPRNHGDIYYNHMPATIIQSLQPVAFADSFKFCFERHPIEKCISYYAMLRRSPLHQSPLNPKTWEEFLDRGIFPVDQDKYCSESGALLVDRIYRYEDLGAGVADIERRLGVHIGPITAREKSGFRDNTSGVPTFADVVSNAEQRGRIMKAFAASLSLTPYD